MEIKYKKEFYILKSKERKVETEAPAVRIKMLSGDTKVIGMMAPKIQVMVTMPDIYDYNAPLHDILKAKESKLLVYIITNSPNSQIEDITKKFDIKNEFISNDFKNFSLKFGVNLSDELIAKSLYIIDKEGVIKYKEIPSIVENGFDLDEFEENLIETINFKAKGHTHENWMGV